MTLLEPSAGPEGDQWWFKSTLDGFIDPNAVPTDFGVDPVQLAENVAAQMSKAMFSTDGMQRPSMQMQMQATRPHVSSSDEGSSGNGCGSCNDKVDNASGNQRRGTKETVISESGGRGKIKGIVRGRKVMHSDEKRSKTQSPSVSVPLPANSSAAISAQHVQHLQAMDAAPPCWNNSSGHS